MIKLLQHLQLVYIRLVRSTLTTWVVLTVVMGTQLVNKCSLIVKTCYPQTCCKLVNCKRQTAKNSTNDKLQQVCGIFVCVRWRYTYHEINLPSNYYRQTPIEILHTILLDCEKYLLAKTMKALSPANKKESILVKLCGNTT